MKIGKIIVIDGIDGTGKKTQAHLLYSRLKKDKKKVVVIDFPRYEKNFFGKNIKEFLTNEKYNFLKVDPKIASIMYAADRWETKEKILNYINKGYVVIFDRYVSANQIHQGSKIKNEREWLEFIHWLEKLEFQVFKIPKPNLVIYLDLSVRNVGRLIKTRSKNDIADKDIQHQMDSRISAHRLLGVYKNFKMVSCDEGEVVLSREVIHEKVYNLVKKVLK